jgi:hypothetical protein
MGQSSPKGMARRTPDIAPAFLRVVLDDASKLHETDEVDVGVLVLVRPLSWVNEEWLGKGREGRVRRRGPVERLGRGLWQLGRHRERYDKCTELSGCSRCYARLCICTRN